MSDGSRAVRIVEADKTWDDPSSADVTTRRGPLTSNEAAAIVSTAPPEATAEVRGVDILEVIMPVAPRAAAIEGRGPPSVPPPNPYATSELTGEDLLEISEVEAPASPPAPPPSRPPPNSPFATQERRWLSEPSPTESAMLEALPSRRPGHLSVGAGLALAAGLGLLMLALTMTLLGTKKTPEKERSEPREQGALLDREVAPASDPAPEAPASAATPKEEETRDDRAAATPATHPSNVHTYHPRGKGTIRVLRGAGIVFVDGVSVAPGALTVACGPHTFSIGVGKMKLLNVPCGGVVSVGSP